MLTAIGCRSSAVAAHSMTRHGRLVGRSSRTALANRIGYDMTLSPN